jgi:formimidoylglutamase
MHVPHTTPPRQLSTNAGRFASGIRNGSAEGCSIALLGIPDDTGVRLNHGRPGAAEGPEALRSALAAYGARDPVGPAWPTVYDAGDIVPGVTLAETHARVTTAAAALVDAGLFPIAIGGGHDLTFPFVRAVASRFPALRGGVYFDAHLDVRAEDGSGMPFRRLVEHCGITQLHVHGLDVLSNTREHTTWFAAHGGRIDPFTHEDAWPEGELFVSLDLDVIDQAYAPGVSAMNPAGWSPATAEAWVCAAGKCDRVRCFDIMELSPPHDDHGRTARLTARLLLAFLRGFSERKKPL